MRLGFNVRAAFNGREALEHIKTAWSQPSYFPSSPSSVTAAQSTNNHTATPKPDIILMDVQMPIIDGYRCTHIMRHHAPYRSWLAGVPIIAMTASAIAGERHRCRMAGMDDYLCKPVTLGGFEETLVHWCSRRMEGEVHAVGVVDGDVKMDGQGGRKWERIEEDGSAGVGEEYGLGMDLELAGILSCRGGVEEECDLVEVSAQGGDG